MESAQQNTAGAARVNANEAKMFKAHAAPQGLCDNLINALQFEVSSQASMTEAEGDSWMG